MVVRTTAAAAALLLTLLAGSARAGTRYVNVALTTGANNGTSWANAFRGVTGLQSALVGAGGDQVWVAQGIYEPTAGSSRTSTFVLQNAVEIYGGFAGTETALDQRDWVAHPTILSGDLNGDDGLGLYTDNSFHVLTVSSGAYILDGLTVRGGNADGSWASQQDRGGGLFSDGTAGQGTIPILRNCIFRENRAGSMGGACYVYHTDSIFSDCRFESNVSGGSGGAIRSDPDSNTRCRRCVFTGNSAQRGGAIELYESPAVITNCVFWNNTATGIGGGGALWVTDTTNPPVVHQCTIAGNHASLDASGGVAASTWFTLANDIIYFNDGLGGAFGLLNNISGASSTYSCVQGVVGGTGNIASDPLFVSLATGDLHISQLSPCADAGNNAALPTGTIRDFDGQPRLADDPAVADTGAGTAPIVDMGAYEVQNTLYTAFCAGDGSLATPCPCGNTGAAGRGCRNSDLLSPGALLAVSGTSNPDTVVLTASDMRATASCIFLQGDQQAASGIVFGDGLRCVAGSLKRLYVKTAVGGTASAPGPGDLAIGARSAAVGDPIAPGTQRYYQVYYRDPVGTFCATPVGNDWNVTSGAIVNW